MGEVWHTLSRRFGWCLYTLSPAINAPGQPEARFRVTIHIRRWHPGYWLYCAGMLVMAWRRAVS